MTFPKLSQNQLNSINFQSLTSVAILITGVIIGLGIMIPSGVFQKGFTMIQRSIPKFPTYQSVQAINDKSSVQSVLESQPRLSFKKNVKFVVFETGDLNCSTCATLHSSTTGGETFYDRFLEDYIKAGKVDYMWVDNQSNVDIKKHTAMYCVGEQSSKRFFDFKAAMYKRYNSGFDLESIQKDVTSLGLNAEKFETCITSKKYDDRVTQLTDFSKNTLGATSNPLFVVYKVETKPLKKLDGTSGTQMVINKLGAIDPTLDYEISFKTGFDKLIK